MRILIVDDNPVNLDLLRTTLNKLKELPISLSFATNGEQAIKIALQSPPDLILLDVMMPGINGFQVCQELRKSYSLDSMPIIFVTAKIEDVQLGFDHGGNDYITKPINTCEVLSRVRHHLKIAVLTKKLEESNEGLERRVRERTAELAVTNRQLREEIKERRYMQDRLHYLASHDFITHLYNRNALDGHVTEFIEKVQLESEFGAFLEVDLNHFRLVNETCGCFAGDELLRQFAELTVAHLNANDFFARLGGDKFAIVCPRRTEQQGKNLALQVDQQVRSFNFIWDERVFPISASIAIVGIDKEILSFDHLLLLADEVLYFARKQKINILSYKQLVLDNASRRENANWAIRLIDAIENNNLRVYYQKIVPLGDTKKKDQGYKIEVLVRMFDPKSNKIIFPDEFIPSAERFNLISKIDMWMIASTLKHLSSVDSFENDVHSVAINLSAISIKEDGIADYIKSTIEGCGINPSKICFELTETEAIGNLSIAKDFMQELHDFGCSFALDDFGTGFSSFEYLRELPFDYVKIDGVFVKDMHKNSSHYAMVKSIVDISKQLDKEVVAEFVENQDIVSALEALGVDWAQGYFFHKPEPIEKISNK